MTVTDLETFMIDNEDRIFRYVVYRKMFTPYELKHAFEDESFYEDCHYTFARLSEAIELGEGEWLLGFRIIDECTGEDFGHTEYHKLSDIKLSCFDCDEEIIYGNNDDFESEDNE